MKPFVSARYTGPTWSYVRSSVWFVRISEYEMDRVQKELESVGFLIRTYKARRLGQLEIRAFTSTFIKIQRNELGADCPVGQAFLMATAGPPSFDFFLLAINLKFRLSGGTYPTPMASKICSSSKVSR